MARKSPIYKMRLLELERADTIKFYYRGFAGLERFDLLKSLLLEMIGLRATLASDEFLSAWQAALAFRGEKVHIWQGKEQPFEAVLLGLETDGSLRVRTGSGEVRSIHFGEVHLRPA